MKTINEWIAELRKGDPYMGMIIMGDGERARIADALETLQRERDEAVAHADRWKWARAALISMRFMSGRHMSSETNICPCLDDDITSEYWDRVADTQRAAIKSGSEG